MAKRYRAEVYIANLRVYCSDWLDDPEDARQLKRDTVQMYQDEGTQHVQGIVRHIEECDK